MASIEEHQRNLKVIGTTIIALIIILIIAVGLSAYTIKKAVTLPVVSQQDLVADVTYPLPTKVGHGVNYRRLQRAGFTFVCGQSVRGTDYHPAIQVIADISLTNVWGANEKRLLDTYAGIDQAEPNRGSYDVSAGDIKVAVGSIIGQHQAALCDKVAKATVSGILSGGLTAELTHALQEKMLRGIDSPFDIRVQAAVAVLPSEVIYSLAKKGTAVPRIKSQDTWSEMQMLPTAPPCLPTPVPRCS